MSGPDCERCGQHTAFCECDEKEPAMTDAKKPEADGIRAAAEEALNQLGAAMFGPPEICKIAIIEQAIRDAVERVEKNTYCAACNCSACTDARHRIRQGG